MTKATEKKNAKKRCRRRISISAADTAMAITRAMAVTRALAMIRVTRSMAKPYALQTARAIIHARNRLPVLRNISMRISKPSTRRRQRTFVRAIQAYWIRIRNIHEKVAYEDIVRAIFPRCLQLRSKGATPSILGAHFPGTIEVAFATGEDAKDAVHRFFNRIQLFEHNWRIMLCKPKELPHAAFSPSLRISEAPECSDDGLEECEQTTPDGAVGTADNARVIISSIDDRVPIEVVVPLFKTVGRVKSHKVLKNSDGRFNGTVELEYEQSKDAHAAAELFHGNIRFFNRKWQVRSDYFDDKEGEDDNDDVDDDDDDDDEEDDDDGGDNNGDDDTGGIH